MNKKILVLSDNSYLLKQFIQVLSDKDIDIDLFTFCYSSNNNNFDDSEFTEIKIYPLNLRNEIQDIIDSYFLIFSIHCKQIFPKDIVNKVKCINIHPGYNPYNRGWFPQVFSINNGLKLGGTIHEMDELVDHGPIIAQESVEIDMSDTSLSAYKKVQQIEIKLLYENIESIINNTYTSSPPTHEGNYNSKLDFQKLCELNLQQIDTLENHINLLRSLSHGDFKNAFFIDKKTGKKIFIKVELFKDEF